MMESQALLAEYARTGSESAFRELVERYVGLVYSTALRLVGGDAHLAEDVSQTVFLDLARKARGLSTKVMLGGWLHQRTFHVAAPMMRAQRRRILREKEAVQMNALQNDSNADLERIAPLLDEAITNLGKGDRAAIMLRFFERRDFSTIGLALGVSEDAARMRLNRALDKLHVLLTRRGATLSAVALGTALATETLAAAPTGLAASITGTTLAGSTGIVSTGETLFKLMASTKVKIAIAGTIIAGGLTSSLIVQSKAQAKLLEQEQFFQQQSGQLERLKAENERLSNLAAQANNSSTDPNQELARLRSQAESLRAQTNEFASLANENRRLKQMTSAALKTPLQKREEWMAKVTFGKTWMLAFRMYAMEHQDKFPANFEEAAQYFGKDGVKIYEGVETNKFEIMKYPVAVKATEATDPVIIIREKSPSLDASGKWQRIYAMADGSVQTVSIPVAYTKPDGQRISYDSFEAWEKQHMPPSSGQ